MRLPTWSRINICTVLLFLPMIAQARPWTEHKNHLGFLLRAISNNENELRVLLDHKKHAKEQAQIAEIMNDIGQRHKELKKLQKDYEEERAHVRFEHPERSDQLEHNYVRHDLKSIEDLENDIGIDGRLDRIRALVLRTFPIPQKVVSKEEDSFRTRLPASTPEIPAEDKPDAVILRK